MDEEFRYSQYLKGRSWLGAIYRQYVLYPRLSSYLVGRTLDYGCGIGDFLRYRPHSVGVDINCFNVDSCTKSGCEALLIKKEEPLPFADCSFSSAVMDNVIEHIPECQIAGVLLEIRRVLVSGAVLIVGVPSIKGYQADSDHKINYTKNTLVSLLEEFDFDIHGAFYMPLNVPFLGRYLSAHCLYTVYQLRK